MLWLPALHDSIPTGPLVRIPLLLASTALAKYATAPPNPPARAAEVRRYGESSASDLLSRPWTWAAASLVNDSLWWGTAALETALVLSTYPPTSPYLPSWATHLHLPVSAAPHAASLPSPTYLLGALLVASGASLRLLCFRALGSLFTFELSVKDGHALVTRGPYAAVRHPSYTGSALIGVGRVLLLCAEGSWARDMGYLGTTAGMVLAGAYGVLALGVPLLLLGRVGAEDRMMRRQFGAEWEAYARRVPWRLVPFVY